MKTQVTITRNHNGSLNCCTVHNGRLISRNFYGYTMKEARRLFVQELKDL